MTTRRQVLKAGLSTATLFVAGRSSGVVATTGSAWVPTLDPRTIAKYVTPLPIPAVMPADSSPGDPVDRYVIGSRQVRQQILPPGSPATTLWAYGSVRHPETFRTPGLTLETTAEHPVRVTWVNELVDKNGDYLPHLLPVDQTLHWAYPAGGRSGRDSRPAFAGTPGGYRGPVPIITHLHGGFNREDSDGYPEAWYLPAARNVPAGYATEGSKYADFKSKFADREGIDWKPGEAVFQYDNEQPASTLWYHDHTLGMTRLSVYAGLAGFYLIRGGVSDLESGALPGPAPRADDPPGTLYHEIPILIQDRSFGKDGSLAYPGSRASFDDRYGGPYIPRSHIPPIWHPEFFGDAMMVNGRTWPVLEMQPRRYRFRFLNGCNSRFVVLKVATDPLARRPVTAALPFWQIGADGGFLPVPVRLDRLLMAPAERADVIVDFGGIKPGTAFYLINEGPDGPFSGAPDTPPADPATTGQVMKFLLRPLAGRDDSVPAADLTLPRPSTLGAETMTRKLALVENKVKVRSGAEAVSEVVLGTLEKGGTGKMWSDPVTEKPALGSTEVWEIHNFTMDAHPIHVHEVHCEVVDRRSAKGPARPPEPWERGLKDTVIAYPDQVTRIKMLFDRLGLFVWHCHILEHEDNEMMRPFRVGP